METKSVWLAQKVSIFFIRNLRILFVSEVSNPVQKAREDIKILSYKLLVYSWVSEDNQIVDR